MQNQKKQKTNDANQAKDTLPNSNIEVPDTAPLSSPDVHDNKINVEISLDRESYTPLDACMAYGNVRVECVEELIETAKFAPWDLVLCVDDSGSMQSRLQVEKVVLEFLIRAFVGKPGRLALVSFNSSSTVHIPLQSVTAASVEALVLTMQSALTAEGFTDLGAGIVMALRELRTTNFPSRTRGVILISDGQPTEGETKGSRIQKLVREDPNAQGTMFSALAIGSGCDTTLLSNLCSEACGGSLFEISGDANPARELGAMVGLGFSQRLVEPLLVLRARGVGFEAPHDACGLRHTRSIEDGTLTYFLGNMSAGELRTIMFHVNLTGGSGSVRATLVANHAIGGAIVSVVAGARASSITANVSSSQDPSLALQIGTIHAINAICEIQTPECRGQYDCNKLRCVREVLLALIVHHGPLANARDEERAQRVARRLTWCIEMGTNFSGLEQLRRTTKTELVLQRSTTMQATQDALEGLGIVSGVLEYEPLSCPLLARQFSQDAEQFSQEHADYQEY